MQNHITNKEMWYVYIINIRQVQVDIREAHYGSKGVGRELARMAQQTAAGYKSSNHQSHFIEDSLIFVFPGITWLRSYNLMRAHQRNLIYSLFLDCMMAVHTTLRF